MISLAFPCLGPKHETEDESNSLLAEHVLTMVRMTRVPRYQQFVKGKFQREKFGSIALVFRGLSRDRLFPSNPLSFEEPVHERHMVKIWVGLVVAHPPSQRWQMSLVYSRF